MNQINPKFKIAILPFDNISQEDKYNYLGDGLTEEIINALSQIPGFGVMSRTSSILLKEKSISLQEMADQYKVDIVVEGSIRVALPKIRISCRLVNVKEDHQVWSSSWDRQMHDIFQLQDEMSLLIADSVREQLGHVEYEDHLTSGGSNHVDVFQLHLKARHLFNKWNPEDIKTSIDLYNRVLELDPNNAEAYVGLADAYGFMATTEFMPREEAWQQAAYFTQRALQLNDRLPGVHYQLANLSFFVECDYAAAFEHTQKAIELKPSYPEAQQFMAFLYIIKGDLVKGGEHLKFALSIDPFNLETKFYNAYYTYRDHRYEEALKRFDELLDINDKNIPALVVKSYILLKLKRTQELLNIWQSLPQDVIIPHEFLGIKTLAFILDNEPNQYLPLISELETISKEPMAFQAHTYLLLSYSLLGRYDDAFEWIEKMLTHKSSILLLSFTDPLNDGLTTDSRYEKVHHRLYALDSVRVSETDAKSNMSDAMCKDLSKRIQAYMDSEKPYLNPALSLRNLAEQLEIGPNQLSYVINAGLGANFNEFVNSYRVAYFKKIATDPTNAHISMVGLAYESGFNSKTVFNTFFKKKEGLTPGQFIKQHKTKSE